MGDLHDALGETEDGFLVLVVKPVEFDQTVESLGRVTVPEGGVVHVYVPYGVGELAVFDVCPQGRHDRGHRP
ncbi:hypothetical protein SAV14893_052900 [Streptomyces avermitilis]|uniref:Uncharacterized protein n=1 Tax=Streptomyces avermitilis TaxID=33903 RepID=A0A4D4M2E9_STRAX|nr:hypothetical protein SAV14893_052900 [Streptomyces avermitilis]